MEELHANNSVQKHTLCLNSANELSNKREMLYRSKRGCRHFCLERRNWSSLPRLWNCLGPQQELETAVATSWALCPLLKDTRFQPLPESGQALVSGRAETLKSACWRCPFTIEDSSSRKPPGRNRSNLVKSRQRKPCVRKDSQLTWCT